MTECADYVEIRLDKKTGDITIYNNGEPLPKERIKDENMPIEDLGNVKSLDLAVIYHTSPGCIWYRGRLYCW